MTRFEKPQHRMPFDMHTPMLQICTGCTHNKCHFCSIFIDDTFKISPIEEIIEDADEIARTAMATEKRRIMLSGGNPFAIPNAKLIPILDTIKEHIPECEEFGGFCRITDIKRRSDEDLAELANYVDMITIGAESGYDPALEFMEKGQTSADLIEQGKRMHEAGIRFCFFYLTGLAGAGMGQENALASARVFSEAEPDYILVVTLTPTQKWPLADDIAAGTWTPPTEVEMAEEIRTFVANLTCKTFVNVSHDTDIIRFEAQLPADRDNALALLDNRIPQMNPQMARKMRELIHHATF